MQQQMTEEQAKELQEKLKDMSPEELREFQKKQCIFCQIISGKVQSKKVYEDDIVFAILDINPANPGHILVLTKEHYSIMPQVPDDEIKHIGEVSKALSQVLLKSLKLEGTNIFIANGVAAGQKAQHFMVHIIPRKEKDGLNFDLVEKDIDDATLEKVRAKVKEKVNSILGIEEVESEVKKPKIVEAEFEEKEEDKKEEEDEEKEKIESEEEKDDDVSLDDISSLLGGKK